MTISFRASKNNFRLTDFEDVKELVIANAVRNVPATIKAKGLDRNQSLSIF
jgi:hypothetical protein